MRDIKPILPHCPQEITFLPPLPPHPQISRPLHPSIPRPLIPPYLHPFIP